MNGCHFNVLYIRVYIILFLLKKPFASLGVGEQREARPKSLLYNEKFFDRIKFYATSFFDFVRPESLVKLADFRH